MDLQKELYVFIEEKDTNILTLYLDYLALLQCKVTQHWPYR